MVRTPLRKFAFWAGGLALFCGLVLYYIFFYSYAFPVNSDNMYFIHAAEDVLAGNVLLKGWNGGFFGALTGDILWAAGLRLFLSQKAVLYLIGPLSYALIVLFSWLILSALPTESSGWIRGVLLLAIVFVPAALRHNMLTVGMHGIAIATILILTWLAARLDQQKGIAHAKWLSAAYALLLWGGCLADGFVLYYFALPAILVLIIELLRGRRILRGLLGLTILAAAGGILTDKLISRFGFLQTVPTSFSLISFSDLPHYLQNSFRTWFLMFGFDPAADLSAIAVLRGMAGLVVMALTISAALRYFKQPFSIRILLFCCLLNAGSFTLTGVTNGEPAVRYLSPAFFAATIVAAAQILSWRPEKRHFAWAAALLLGVFGLSNLSLSWHSAPVSNQAYVEIADALKDRGITRLYATYWETHALSYYSGEKFISAPITVADGRIVPYQWSSKADWYQPAFEADCVLVSQNKRYGITEALLVEQFGEFQHHLAYLGTDLYFYDKNLSALITESGD